MRVGFVGAGNMAAAMARGWAAAGRHAPAMSFSDSGSGRAADLAAEVGGEAADGPAEQLAAEVIVLAVKPRALESVAADLAGYDGVVLSVLGATPLAALRAALGPAPAVVRTMPNVAVERHLGVICWCAASADRDRAGDAIGLLAALGETIELPEEKIDAATAVMGCSLAYFALAAEALERAGVAAGLDQDGARHMIGAAVSGTGSLLERHDPAALQRAVASPGGSTEAGLEALHRAGVPAGFEAAVGDSLKRMRGEL